MKNIIGPPARGENFYNRSREVNSISLSLNNGNNLQITAPRRVGKTSILWYLLDNDIDGRSYVYVDTESIANEQEFYKKLLTEIVRHQKISKSSGLVKAIQHGAGQIFRKIGSITVAGTGIEFNHDSQINDYYEELQNFLIGYAATDEAPLVLLIDEFPQTIENIKTLDEDAARTFLKTNRELRMRPELSDRVGFIYTGSIGLNQTVARLGATSGINDLNSIEVGPLKKEEAIDFFHGLLRTGGIEADTSADETLLQLLEWYIPFHIQLIAQQILDPSSKEKMINSESVQKAVEEIMHLRSQQHFDHYRSRLRTQFKGNDLKYADEVLQKIAKGDAVRRTALADLAAKYNLTDEYRHILDSLTYDGYIHVTGDQNEYRFNSPIVKMWWLKFVC